MLLAIINGGLGLQLANNSRNGKIAYAVVAAVVGVVYIAMCVFKRKGSGSASVVTLSVSLEPQKQIISFWLVSGGLFVGF